MTENEPIVARVMLPNRRVTAVGYPANGSIVLRFRRISRSVPGPDLERERELTVRDDGRIHDVTLRMSYEAAEATIRALLKVIHELHAPSDDIGNFVLDRRRG